MAQDEEIRFAWAPSTITSGSLRLEETQRWDVVKWAVTINVALAAASIAVKQKDAGAGGPFSFFAFVIAVVAYLLVVEINRRMTKARNDSLAPHSYLIKHGINVAAITGKALPDRYRWDYDREELGVCMH